MMDEKESVGSDTMAVTGLPIFQGLLMNFLDEKAPVIDENSLESAREGFHNLIHLFSELIRHDVFSHDAYMCTLISRGDLASTPAVTMPTEDSIDLSSIQSECIKHEPPDEIKMDLDLNMDDDLTNLFKFEHDEMRMSPEQPASVKSMKSEPMPSDVEAQPSKASSRHLLYTLHFPIPQDEDSSHECNQRMVVLYGVGKARDDARHFIKKITKELLKMFSKKNCLDMSSGDLGKARRKKERERDSDLSTNLMEGTLHKFQKLSYFDQHYVISHCAQTVLEQILAFNSGNSNYLPQVDNISYLFDLMENALNISSLLEFAVQLLTELSEVEAQLVTRQSSPCGVYTTSLCLCIVGLFRKYHAYLLVSPELTIQVFDGLIGVVKHVINPSDCTSAERCILAHLYDVYTCCSYLKQAKLFDVFSVNAYPQIKMSLYADAQPAASNLLWDPTFMVDYINNAKSQPDPLLVKLLNEKAANRYSFVCNAMLCISNSQGTDRLNDVYILCAELTAKCNMLSSEWLGVLKALCCSANHSCGFIDILTQIEVSDLSIHDSLAVFTAILVARHCFSLQDFVGHVALPSLLAACPSAGGEQDAESGARLTCHLLLRLFKPSYMSISPLSRQGRSNLFGIKSSVDMHLLEAAHDTITVGAVLAMLKAMLVLGDSCSDDNKNKSSANSSTPKERDILSSLLSSLDDNQFMEATTMCGTKGSKGFMESAGLSDFAKHSLREMCSMKWVRDKILKDPESLFHSDMLLDSMLSNKQAQQLLQMVCYPDGIPNQMDICEPDTRQAVQRILQTLDQWSLRVSWLEMQLMYEQAGTAAEKNTVLDSIAKGTMDLFHQQTEMLSQSDLDIFSQPSKLGSDCCVWLVAPLISKLPSAIQGRVLKLAGQVLEFGNNFFSKSKFDKEKNQKSKSLLGHQPFLSLVLTCLKGQDDQREGLLSSLLLQLERFISNAKDALDKSPDEGKIRQNIHETLQIRLSLVGGMFDTIQRNNATTVEWAQLLLQLISNGVVDMETNGELFTTVLDMLTILILGTLLNEGSEKGEDSKKNYMNLMKKLKRELGDKNTEATDKLRQLLPLSKKTYEVITCEPHGTLVDSKGNKITFDSKAKKQGLQVTSKVTISPWDMIEGHKNMAPLSWTHFGAVRMGKTPLKYENQHRLLLYHNHSLRQPASYFLEPPPLPPEELEPPPEKMEEKNRDHMESHKESNDSKKTKQPRRRRTPRAPNSTSFPQHQPRHVFHGTEPVYQTGPPSNWYPPSQPQQQPQPAYYPQQHPSPAGGPRFGAPQQYTTKQALVNLLHHRQPAGGQGYIQSRQVPMPRHMMNQKQQMIPQRLSGQGMQNRMPDSMYGGNQSTPPAQLRHMGGTHAIGQQNYHQYGQMQTPANQPLSEPTSSSYSQPYQAGAQNSGIMQQPHENYINQQPPQQYSQSSRLQHGMGPTPGGGMSGYSQLPPATSQSPSSYIQPHSQQQQYVLRQQQLMAMKQQQQQTPQQQKTAALVAQLQRQMSHTQPGPAQQYPPTSAVMEQSQYNTYPQPPGY